MTTIGKAEPQYTPDAKLIQVLMVTYLAGSGDGPRDPYRRPTAYFMQDGTLLANVDNVAHELRKDDIGYMADLASQASKGILDVIDLIRDERSDSAGELTKMLEFIQQIKITAERLVRES